MPENDLIELRADAVRESLPVWRIALVAIGVAVAVPLGALGWRRLAAALAKVDDGRDAASDRLLAILALASTRLARVTAPLCWGLALPLASLARLFLRLVRERREPKDPARVDVPVEANRPLLSRM